MNPGTRKCCSDSSKKTQLTPIEAPGMLPQACLRMLQRDPAGRGCGQFIAYSRPAQRTILVLTALSRSVRKNKRHSAPADMPRHTRPRHNSPFHIQPCDPFHFLPHRSARHRPCRRSGREGNFQPIRRNRQPRPARRSMPAERFAARSRAPWTWPPARRTSALWSAIRPSR